EGTQIHLTATLVRAENEEPLWSERFESEFATLWNLEREIISRIARRLDVTHADVGPHSPPEAAQDAAALDSLLRANAVANEPTTARTVAEAGRLFTLALRSPSRAVEAKAGLAAVHLVTALSSRLVAHSRELAPGRIAELSGDPLQAFRERRSLRLPLGRPALPIVFPRVTTVASSRKSCLGFQKEKPRRSGAKNTLRKEGLLSSAARTIPSAGIGSTNKSPAGRAGLSVQECPN